VTAERSAKSDTDHQVLPFRPRNLGPNAGHGARRSMRAAEAGAPPPLKDLAEYERVDDSEDNYHHRMMVNLAALLVIVILSAAGAWLAMQIAEMRKTQDCVLSGRRNCAPIEMKTPGR
jgi:hypothetical protein